MRIAVAGAAVLCLVAVQPASAAWQTSAPGTSPAKAGQVVSPGPITCTVRKVEWRAVGGPAQYRVYFASGNSPFPATPDVVTADTTATAPGSGKISVLVRAAVGSWTSEASAEKICS